MDGLRGVVRKSILCRKHSSFQANQLKPEQYWKGLAELTGNIKWTRHLRNLGHLATGLLFLKENIKLLRNKNKITLKEKWTGQFRNKCSWKWQRKHKGQNCPLSNLKAGKPPGVFWGSLVEEIWKDKIEGWSSGPTSPANGLYILSGHISRESRQGQLFYCPPPLHLKCIYSPAPFPLPKVPQQDWHIIAFSVSIVRLLLWIRKVTANVLFACFASVLASSTALG